MMNSPLSSKKHEVLGVFSSPRSGSTWLAQLLFELPLSALLYEPLNTGDYKTTSFENLGYYLPEVEQLGFYHNQAIPEHAEWIEAQNFFEKLFNKRILHPTLYWGNDVNEVLNAQHLLAKFCYGNLLLPWLTKHFPVKAIALIRHPCAVVNSQLNNKGWNPIIENPTYTIPNFKFREEYAQYQEIFDSIKTPEENLAATWAITWKKVLEHPSPSWLLVSYERLLTRPNEELQCIFEWLEKPVPKAISNLVKIPSRSSESDKERIVESDKQLVKWKTELTEQQVENILRIVDLFGITAFSKAPEPDYERLFRNQPNLNVAL